MACLAPSNASSSSVKDGPSLMVSLRTDPTLLSPPETISSLANPGCHLLRLSKSLIVAHTLSTGALISTLSTTFSVCGGSAHALPCSSAAPKTRAISCAFILLSPKTDPEHNLRDHG